MLLKQKEKEHRDDQNKIARVFNHIRKGTQSCKDVMSGD